MRHSISSLSLIILALALVGCGKERVKTNVAIEAEPRAVVVIAEKDVSSFQELESLLENQSYDAAEVLALSLLESYPNHVGLITNAGMIELRRQRYDEALAQLNKALELEPTAAHALAFKAEILFHRAEYQEAAANYTLALRHDKTLAYAHFGLGVIYDLYLMDFDLAAQHYKAFIESDAQDIAEQDRKKASVWLRLLERKKS